MNARPMAECVWRASNPSMRDAESAEAKKPGICVGCGFASEYSVCARVTATPMRDISSAPTATAVISSLPVAPPLSSAAAKADGNDADSDEDPLYDLD